MDCIEAFKYDLLLLDVILPKLDGISLCRHIRSQGYMMPILLLTSKDSNHDRAVGLDAGADDYAIKPFDPEELSARIRALLRRGNDNVQPILTWKDLTLDPRNCEVTYQERVLTLTPKEYALLELFLRHNRRLFSCGAILEHLWTYEDAPSEEAVRTHIKGTPAKNSKRWGHHIISSKPSMASAIASNPSTRSPSIRILHSVRAKSSAHLPQARKSPGVRVRALPQFPKLLNQARHHPYR